MGQFECPATANVPATPASLASSSCKLIVDVATGSIEATSSAEPVTGSHDDREGEHAKTGTLYEVAKDTIGDIYLSCIYLAGARTGNSASTDH